MERRKDSIDDIERTLKLKLLAEETSDCVCSRVWEKSLILGWRPSEEQKEQSRKKCGTSRCGNQGLLRREKTVLAATGDFLFRHYESPDRYMAQYRENHSTSCMEREMNFKPVLGIDVPDPYLPNITSASLLMERIEIIDALSEFYKFPRDTSALKDICLTGTKTDTTDRRYLLPPTPKQRNDAGTLPALTINSVHNNLDDSQCLPTVQEHKHEESAEAGQELSVTDVYSSTGRTKINNSIHCVRFEKNKNDKSHIEAENKSPNKESFVLPAAKIVCNDTEKQRECLRTAFPRIPLWTEYELVKERRRHERVLETLRIGRKCKPSKKGVTGNDKHEESVNLGTRLDTREGMPPSRGNLRLGTTVRPATNHKDVKQKFNIAQTKQNKHDLYNNYLTESSRSLKKPKLPVETNFIKILGHQTASPAKPLDIIKTEREKATPRSKLLQSSDKDYQGIPLRYLRKFGRHNFNHVLEARSYKPETRKLGTTSIPN